MGQTYRKTSWVSSHSGPNLKKDTVGELTQRATPKEKHCGSAHTVGQTCSKTLRVSSHSGPNLKQNTAGQLAQWAKPAAKYCGSAHTVGQTNRETLWVNRKLLIYLLKIFLIAPFPPLFSFCNNWPFSQFVKPDVWKLCVNLREEPEESLRLKEFGRISGIRPDTVTCWGKKIPDYPGPAINIKQTSRYLAQLSYLKTNKSSLLPYFLALARVTK